MLLPPRKPGDDMGPNPNLFEAKNWLRARLADGEHCPCCGQMAKIYKRSIHHTIARSLITMYHLSRDQPDGWVHVPTMLRGTGERGEIGKARYWALVEEAQHARGDGGRAGYWRLTGIGERFVENRWVVKKYARIYDGRCLGFDGAYVNITEALGDHFNYQELMSQ